MKVTVEKEFEEAKLLFDKIGSQLQMANVWPINQSKKRLVLFILFLIYESSYLAMAYNDVYSIIGNLQLVAKNLLGTLIQMIMVMQMAFIRFSGSLKKIIVEISENFNSKNYPTQHEKQIYVQYCSVAKKLYIITMIFGLFSAIGFYLLPLQKVIISWLLHKPAALELPFRVKVFGYSNLSADQTFLLYIYEMPLPINALYYITSINLKFMIIVNICARIAILNNYINSIDPNEKALGKFRIIVVKHLSLLRLTKEFEDTWTPVFLIEMILIIPLLALVMFSVLALKGSDTLETMTLVIYVFSMLSCIFTSCFMGELLINERDRLMQGFYQFHWYEMSIEDEKSWLICMLNSANIPMQITAGKVFIFSFNGFTGVLKCAMSYVSLLRSMIL